jgi:hypothetical protein
LITQLALWATLGVVLGELLHRRTGGHVPEPDYAEQLS